LDGIDGSRLMEKFIKNGSRKTMLTVLKTTMLLIRLWIHKAKTVQEINKNLITCKFHSYFLVCELVKYSKRNK